MKKITQYSKGYIEYISSANKYQGIDLLRSIAVISVVLFHYYDLFKLSVTKIGWMGVDLFFVISGFLIGGIIIDEIVEIRAFSYKNFYYKRLMRIYPVYILATLGTIYANIVVNKNITYDFITLAKQILINMTFLQTYIPFINPNLYNPFYYAGGTWSLVVEEYFYIFCPIVSIILVKLTNGDIKKVLKYLIIIYICAIPVRLLVTRNVQPGDYNWFFAYFTKPHTRFDELISGMIISIIVKKVKINKIKKIILMLIGISVLFGVILYLYTNPTLLMNPNMLTIETIYFPTLLSVGFGCILAAIYDIKIKNHIIITVIAKLSYSLYLMHILALILIAYSIFVRFICGLILAVLVSYFIEYPFIKLYKIKDIKFLNYSIEA